MSMLQFLIIFQYIAKKNKGYILASVWTNSPCIHLSVTESGGHVHQLQ